MKQEDVGKLIGVSTDCVTLWENNRSFPMVHQLPQLIKFLGYNPLLIDQSSIGGQIKRFRFEKGFNLKKMGKILGVDASTVGAWEKNRGISTKNRYLLLQVLNSTNP